MCNAVSSGNHCDTGSGYRRGVHDHAQTGNAKPGNLDHVGTSGTTDKLDEYYPATTGTDGRENGANHTETNRTHTHTDY